MPERRAGKTTTFSARCCAHDRRARSWRPRSCAAISSGCSSRATRQPQQHCRGRWCTVPRAIRVGQDPPGARPAHRAVPHRDAAPHPSGMGYPATPTKARVTLPAGQATTRIRRGQVATIYLRGIHRDPNRWSDPLRFDPSRQDTSAKELQRALLPFGLGSRGCIGQHLAMAEMSAVLPALARHGDIGLEGTVAEDARFALRTRESLPGASPRPEAPMWVRASCSG